MPISIEHLRAAGDRPVTLETADGTFVGRVLQEHLSERSLMLLLERDDEREPLVVAIDRISQVVER